MKMFNLNLTNTKVKPKITYWDNDQKSTEEYYLNGKLHREDGPAYQYWHKNGQKKFELYYLNGNYHREDGPAEQWWHNNGQKQSEIYYLNGKYHREDGPAVQWYNNGQKMEERGPGYHVWYENGQKERYYLNDKEYSRKEWLVKVRKLKLKKINENV